MERVSVYAPGSTSNVGPGFDCLGIAIAGLGDRVDAARNGPPGVRVLSVSDPRIPADARRNTAALAAAAVLARSGAREAGIELVIEKGLPLSGGLGGSAASAVAGALAADSLLGSTLSSDELLECALAAEATVAGRHADNAAPSLLGGAVVVIGTKPLCVVRLSVHGSLRLVFASPSYGVETARARAVLPVSVPLETAVRQASALAGLVLGLERGDLALLRSVLVDRLAEPHRASLYPGYGEARRAALEAGAAGVVVSGAGPTLLALAGAGAETAVGEALTAAYRRAGFEACIHVTTVDPLGARLS